MLNVERLAAKPLMRPYQILPLIEHSPAWWEWRRGGIGSSDAATVLGLKPAKSCERLLFEKLNPREASARSFVREQGVKLERAARAQYGLAVGVPVAPGCVQSIARPWQRASLDGLSADGQRVVEIKCGRAAHQRAAARNWPPPNHYAQLQHILSVTGLPVISYWCYFTACRPVHLEIVRDEPYIARLLVAEERFWQRFGAT